MVRTTQFEKGCGDSSAMTTISKPVLSSHLFSRTGKQPKASKHSHHSQKRVVQRRYAARSPAHGSAGRGTAAQR